MNDILEFYKNKRVLITGHTGFKGTWLTRILLNAGAIVCGYSLSPPTDPALYNIAGLENYGTLKSITGDIRDLDKISSVFKSFKPEIVFHLAAQPIVRDSYKNPRYTYETNVMGTVNVLECIRLSLPGEMLNKDSGWAGIKSFVNITTDKVYYNNEWSWGYRENEPLDGYDPYSNSKSCSELVTHSYKNSFFGNNIVGISTARAGNVIGGGDFANDRIIPDSVRTMYFGMQKGEKKAVIQVRNPFSTRPYQHVLEPLSMYLTIAKAQWEDKQYADYYNVGPDDSDCVKTGELVSLFVKHWNDCNTNPLYMDNKMVFPEADWENKSDVNAPHEAKFLKLDCSLIKSKLNYIPVWHIDEAVKYTVEFSKVWMAGGSVAKIMDMQIERYFEAFNCLHNS